MLGYEKFVVSKRDKNARWDVDCSRPGYWGNEFKDGTREENIQRFKHKLVRNPAKVRKARRELRGKILACWCDPLDCHAHVLAYVANCSDEEFEAIEAFWIEKGLEANVGAPAPTSPVLFGNGDRETSWLHNWSKFPVSYALEGLIQHDDVEQEWPTSEHLYQALRLHNYDLTAEAYELLDMPVRDATMYARGLLKNRIPDIELQRHADLATMHGVLKLKLQQYPDLQLKLLDTGARQIVELSRHDQFWGMSEDGEGRNELGKLWMYLRDQLIAEDPLTRKEAA